MGLRGSAAVVIWSDMPDASKHDHWHSHEHLPERAGIPGLLRSRRYVEPNGAPAYFVLYEVRDAGIMKAREGVTSLEEVLAITLAEE